MSHADFVHLRVHSAYSLSEGAIKIKDLVKLAAADAQPAVAVTDTCNLFGALEFALAAADAGVQPITGAQLSLARPPAAETAARTSRSAKAPTPDPIVLLAQSETGYQNLMALVSRAFLDTDGTEEPQVPWSVLEGQTEGLICLTGGPSGPVGRPLAEGQRPAAEAALDTLQRLFPGRLYVELMRHGMEVEERIEPALVDLAYARDLPLVATNDVFFGDAGMYEAHDALLCIAEGAYVAQEDRRRVTPEHRFKTAAEMRALFADLPEAVDNTLVIARRCAVMAEKRKPILPAYETAAGRTEIEELRAQAEAGLRRRLETHVYTADMDTAAKEAAAAPYWSRLDHELSIIESMGFPGYFLIVADFIQWAKAQDIPVGPGRGSGAGSVVAWALLITDLDPLRFNLLFERFLNPERVSMPDFDIDFCQDRRDEVIAFVRDKYGADRVAQIITFGKLQARAALRDVGRVLQMPFGQVDRLCKMVPNNPANPVTLKEAIDGEPQLQHLRETDADVARLLTLALKIEGLYRNASTHAAGVVIGDRPLTELVPLYRDPRADMPATQFNMKFVEQAGLVKFDFLGLKTLTVLVRAAELIAKHHPERVPDGPTRFLETLPLDDQPTFDMLAAGASTGVFQLESSGMRDVLKQMKPNRFEDIIALVALYRPGPMDNIPTYIATKQGKQDPDYLYPTLQPILEETYGIMIYQEQVMQVAQVLAGYSLGGADLLRRAMGKKIKEEMDKQKVTFVDGAVKNGVPEQTAANIFEQVAKFAGYGFNKSHAAAYALVAYQTAYLKANYPVEFLAASMTLDLNNTDKLHVFKQDLDKLGHPLLQPDVNASEGVFTVELMPAPDGAPPRKAVRYALGAVKGVGVEAMHALVAERRANGAFKGIFDVFRRVDPKVLNRRQLENLVRAGAFDRLDDNRARLVAGMETLVRYAQAEAEQRESGQNSLFGGPGAALETPKLPVVPGWDPLETLRQEFDAVGFYLSAHPIESYPVKRVGAVPCAEIGHRYRDGNRTLRLAGIVTAKRELRTKSGNRMCFVMASDASGGFEVTLFQEVYFAVRELLEPNTPLLFTVEVQQKEDGEYRLTATEVAALDAAVKNADTALQVYVADAAAARALADRLQREGKGRGRITAVVPIAPGEEAEIELGTRFAITPAGRAAIKAIPGVLDVAMV